MKTSAFLISLVILGCASTIAFYIFLGAIAVWLWQVKPVWALLWLAFWITINAMGSRTAARS